MGRGLALPELKTHVVLTWGYCFTRQYGVRFLSSPFQGGFPFCNHLLIVYIQSQLIIQATLGVYRKVKVVGILRDETIKSSINTALMYLAGNLYVSALCFLAFVIAYKLHIYVGFPLPSLDGLSFILVVCTFLFKKKVEGELRESGTSIQDALPKLATRTLCGVIALVLVLNMDTIVNAMISFNHWFLNEFK